MFAVEEGCRRWGEVVFVEEVIKTGDVRRVWICRRVGFPFSRFWFFVDGDAIEGAVAVSEVVLICFLAVVRYAEYSIIGVAVFAQEREEELVGVLGRLYVGEAFDDGIVVIDGVVVASAVDDGRDEDAVVEVISAVVVVMIRWMVVRSVDRRFVMWRSAFVEAIAVRRSVVWFYVRSVIGVRSVFVKAVTATIRSVVRFHLGSWLRSGLWFHLGSWLRFGLRFHLGS